MRTLPEEESLGIAWAWSRLPTAWCPLQRLFFYDLTWGKEILDLIRETTPSSICITKTYQEKSALSNWGLTSAEFELSSRLYLKICWRYLSWTTKKNPLWSFFLIFHETMSQGVEEGVVGMRGSFFMTHLFQLQFPRRSTVRKPIMFPRQR